MVNKDKLALAASQISDVRLSFQRMKFEYLSSVFLQETDQSIDRSINRRSIKQDGHLNLPVPQDDTIALGRYAEAFELILTLRSEHRMTT